MSAAIAMFMLIGTSVWAAARSETGIGVVDVKRVYADAPRMKQLTDELAAYEQSLYARLNIRVQNAMLGEDEINELAELKGKAKPTDVENKRINALTSTERSRDEELKTLQGTKKLSDQQKTDLKKLQDLQRSSKKACDTEANGCDTLLQSKSKDLWSKADSEMRAAVSIAAAAKKITVVLAKEIAMPDGGVDPVVMLGGVDITNDVISKLVRKS